jgi:type IV pilus assembly protein PilY1
MKTNTSRPAPLSGLTHKAGYLFAAAALAVLVSSPAYAEVSQTPLYLGGGNVPGNLTLVPSVEWPTINSVANLDVDYNEGATYVGYFDPAKCYEYHYESTEANRHFYPTRYTSNHRCTNTGEWSGNFLNWATTQTIDPFRSVLTGGYRVRDTSSETWLEKARHDGQGGTGIFPDRRLPVSGDDLTLLQGATPLTANWISVQIEGLSNKMRLRMQDEDVDDTVLDYDPSLPIDLTRAYELSVRVAVCVPGLLEPNCRAYPNGNHKPEGLIHQYADELRIGVFGYLNDHDIERDGGVLRARQKFVGPTMIEPGQGEVTNPNREWDPATGVFVQNPDIDDAAATASWLNISINDSGAINYLNKFGQLTSNNHKSKDPVSELYYTALRYLKAQGNVPEYTSIPGNTGIDATQAADGFPVITDWDDPIQYACQKNVILGIGDVYTHRDKNLPGSTSGSEEPPMPSAVRNDSTVDVASTTGKVAGMEGITIGTPFTGRNNSAYIAGLAWDAHTRDIRPDLAGEQTVSTHWVDVLEAQSLEPPERNQYYLATKYGGFDIPEDFDPDTHSGPLPLEWWHTNGDVLQSFGRGASPSIVTFNRPDNYYLAGEANQMVESLTKAFARISAEVRSSASSVAANSTRLGSDTAVFQAAFDSTRWSGELQAFRITEDGSISEAASWKAAEKLDALSEFSLSSRKILTVTPPTTTGDGSEVSTTGIYFEWSDLASEQQDALRQQQGGGSLEPTAIGQDRLDYVRGSRVDEQPDGLMRRRDSRLGDIVNSDPQFIHHQDFGYMLLDRSEAFGGSGAGAAYESYRNSSTYQNRPPMVVVGANDGMLHGFDASLSSSGGNELFAFVPAAAFEHLYELTLPEYAHRFFVDGSPRAADALLNGSWRTIVVGTTGAGGKSVFALDVTNPSTMSASSVLWEFSHPSMGYTIGQPSVAPLPNGRFGVVVTSGYETGQDDGVIWILDPADGSVITSFTLDDSGELGAPLVVDLNSDRVADRIYVGDTEGNLWRLDLKTSNMNNWGVPKELKSGSRPQPLFVARDAGGLRRPITAPLTSAFNDKGMHMVFFGTGTFYRVDDNVVPDNPGIDTFYGIIDRGEVITGRSDLREQVILTEQTVQGTRVRGVSAYEMESGHDGWFLDLVWHSSLGGPGPAGERVVSKATVRGDRVIFATLIPNPDPCAFGGESWLMELNTFTGGRLPYAVFDINADGTFDQEDWITVTDENGNEIQIPPSAINPDINIIKTPAVIAGVGENNDEVKVMSGSSGDLIRVSERGGVGIGRQSWRQLR